MCPCVAVHRAGIQMSGFISMAIFSMANDWKIVFNVMLKPFLLFVQVLYVVTATKSSSRIYLCILIDFVVSICPRMYQPCARFDMVLDAVTWHIRRCAALKTLKRHFSSNNIMNENTREYSHTMDCTRVVARILCTWRVKISLEKFKLFPYFHLGNFHASSIQDTGDHSSVIHFWGNILCETFSRQRVKSRVKRAIFCIFLAMSIHNCTLLISYAHHPQKCKNHRDFQHFRVK